MGMQRNRTKNILMAKFSPIYCKNYHCNILSYEEREILVLENPLLPSSQIDVIIVSVGIKSRISFWIIRQLQDHFVSVSGFMDQKKRYPLLMLNPILNPFCLFKHSQESRTRPQGFIQMFHWRKCPLQKRLHLNFDIFPQLI